MKTINFWRLLINLMFFYIILFSLVQHFSDKKREEKDKIHILVMKLLLCI